jgi:hypothetical protein
VINPGRFTAEVDGEFVLFLIGSQIHKPWKIRQWLPVARAMTVMQREIAEHPEIGCLHIENFGTLRNISVQYWRTFDDLERFARSGEWSHLEAWRRFNRLIRDSGDLGVWHETFRVAPDQFESVYANMPVFGLAAAGRHVPVNRSSTAAGRIRRRAEDQAPVEAY